MASDGCFSFPEIDFSDSKHLRPGTSAWNLVKSQVLKAAEEYGCFMALFKKIPQHLQVAMNEASEELFQLPPEIKKRNVSEKPFHGYLGSSSPSSVYESLAIVEPDNYTMVENFTNLFWSGGNKKLSDTLHSFSESLVELDQTIRRMIVESLGVEKYLEEHINSTKYFLRVARYQHDQTAETITGLRAHTDKNIITIFYQNQVNGLEMQTKNGEWIPIKFPPNSFFILVGESFRAWANSRIYSPYHRVMTRGNKPRYSALLFSMPKDDYVIKAVEELVDEDHPSKFKPFYYHDYINRRFADNNSITITVPPLKNYFGA